MPSPELRGARIEAFQCPEVVEAGVGGPAVTHAIETRSGHGQSIAGFRAARRR
jgi:hypothetical protein